MRKDLRESGIDIIGDVPWGTHFCQFYHTKEDLAGILVPYFKAGLENNEFCLWITSYPLGVEGAKEFLKKAVPNIDDYLEKGQIEIISYTCLNVTGSIYDSERIINYWIEKLNHALESGYEGLRLSGNTSWLEKKDWGYYVDYMGELDNIIRKYKMIALGSYFIDKYRIAEITEVVSNHQFSLVKRERKWEKIDNFGRKKAEETAIRATKDWEHTFDAVPDLIAIIDTEYRVVRANKAMAARLGVTPEECVGLTCYRVVHGADKPPSFCPHRQLLKDGFEHTKEVHEDALGGDFIVSVSPLHDSEGRLTGCIHVARNINERKQSEEALKKAHESLEEKVKERTAQLEKAYSSLKESEERLSEAQKMAHIGNWDWDIATDEKYWSDEVYRIFGLKPQEFKVTYDTFLSYVHPDDRDYVDNASKEALKRKPYRIDFRIISAGGKERIVHEEGKVVFYEKNIPVRMKGTIQDITEHKKAEEKLRESEEKYRNIVEIANEGIAVLDSEGKLTYINRKFSEMLGYSEKEICGKYAGDIVEDVNLFKRMFNKRQFGISESYEIKLIRKDGSTLWVLINAKSLFDDKGKFKGSLSMLTDITERKETEEALANLDIARQKEIHHRIKNNLQVISSLLDLQAENFSDCEVVATQKVLEAFKESQNRVFSMSLIHEELYKGNGFDTLNFSSYIQKLAIGLFQAYRLDNSNIVLSMDLEKNVFFNMDTAVPLGIIINELVSNSLKYAFPGKNDGEIRIKLHREEGSDTSFILIVSDNGVGIPENLDIENLDSLGLQLVTTLVDQLDGELELKRNNGTAFIIRFTVIF